MNRLSAIGALALAASLFSHAKAEPPGSTAPELQWPAADQTTRPWAYWWWMGSAVNPADLTRNLEICRRAGYGGLHIIPIYGAKGWEDQYIEYLSPRWMEMLDHTVREARRLGMGIDMTTGTGWCFGGPHVAVADGCAKLAVEKESVAAGGRLARKYDKSATQSLMAYSADGEVLDITDRLTGDGAANWTAPAGRWTIYAVSQKSANRRVKRAAPGGEGLMLNAFSVRAMRRYLKTFDAALDAYSGLLPRAMYHDSYEYAGDWADNLLEEFERRRGYRLQTHLPALLGEGSADEIARVRCDYNETLSDMHLDYIRTWVAWSHSRGFLTRDQAHGSPSNLLDTYAAADIPETEMFHTDRDIFISKFASSAAHVAGRRLVASETGTWLDEHFNVTLAQMKELVDRLFLSGVNHVIYHGTCYSPEEARWPGWVFYASTEMNWRNPIWRDAPALNAYITRCQSVLQAGEPDGDVLLYWPLHDLWTRRAERKIDFSVHRPWLEGTAFRAVAGRLWERGWQFDYVSDRQLQQASAAEGAMGAAGGRRRAVVVPECEVIPPETMEALLRLARGGAAVIFQKSPPREPPGLERLAERREAIRRLLASLRFEGSGGVKRASAGQGEVLAAEDVDAALTAVGAPREPLTDSTGLKFVRRKHESGWCYFLVNQGDSPVDGWIPLARRLESAVIMDPMSGRCGWAAVERAGAGPPRVYLQVAPGQSVILRTFRRPRAAGPAWDYERTGGGPVELRGPWKLSFVAGGPSPPPPMTVQRLGDWTALESKAAKSLGGTVRYEIRLDEPAPGGRLWRLDLGRVCESARVRLNGQEQGVVFAPPWRIRLGHLLPKGNLLEIDVTNCGANRIRDLDRRGVAWKIFHDINYVDIHYKPFDASQWPLRPSGLLGPVRLLPLEPLRPTP